MDRAMRRRLREVNEGMLRRTQMLGVAAEGG